jgi:hypothetical protein
MRTRRALLGLMAGFAAAAISGVAEARSGAPWTCESFSQWVDGWDGIVRARVVTSGPVVGVDSGWARDVSAETVAVMWGRPRITQTYVFQRVKYEMMDGAVLGHLPEAGETVVLMLNNMGDDPDQWSVANLWAAKDFDRWAKRCRLY